MRAEIFRFQPEGDRVRSIRSRQGSREWHETAPLATPNRDCLELHFGDEEAPLWQRDRGVALVTRTPPGPRPAPVTFRERAGPARRPRNLNVTPRERP
jgi:hypothetical protein